MEYKQRVNASQVGKSSIGQGSDVVIVQGQQCQAGQISKQIGSDTGYLVGVQ